MPKPPVDPGYFDKVNYIIDSWSTFCDAPWYIYIETMGPAALEAFITLLTFGWDDVARGYWRPKGLGRRWGKRKGRRKGAIRGFPEIGEEIGKRLPGADQVKNRRWGAGGKFIWRIDTLAQRALFWWLVADVTLDFFYEWTSLLYATEWCKQSNLGRFSWRKPTYQTASGGGWRAVNIPDKDYQFPPPVWIGNRGTIGATPCTVGAGMNVKEKPPFPKPGNFSIRIVKRGTDIEYAKTGPMDTMADGTQSLVAAGKVPANTVIQVQIMHDVSFADVGDGFVVAWEDDPP